MPARWMVCGLVAVLCSTSAVRAVDPDRLRAAAYFPAFLADYQLGWFDGQLKQTTSDDREEQLAAEVPRLQNQLLGDDSDAPRYLKLGSLFDLRENRPESRRCFELAADLFRQQLAREPDQVRALAGLAESLCGLDRDDEAEALYRRAVELAPADWRCQLDLAGYLPGKAVRLLLKEENGEPVKEGGQFVLAAKAPLSLAEAAACLREARACWDRALTLAPQEPEVARRRIGVCQGAIFGQRVIAAVPHSLLHLEPDSTTAAMLAATRQSVRVPDCRAAAMFTPAPRAELYRLAQLLPDDYLTQGMLVQTEVIAFCCERGAPQKDRPTLSALPPEIRSRVDEGSARLERLTRSDDRKLAARAALMLGCMRSLTAEDPLTVVPLLRRAVALDPTLEAAWDVLTAVLFTSDREADGMAVLEERLNHCDSAAARLALAKAHYNNKEDAKAAEQLRLALERNPEHFLALVASAALLLRTGKDAAALEEAGMLLAWAEPLAGRDSRRQRDWGLNQAVYLGLTGDPSGARALLLTLLIQHRNDDAIRQALDALGD